MDTTAPAERRTVLLLALAGFVSMASMRVSDAMLPELAAVFDRSIGQVAQSITAFTIAYGLMQLVYGPLGDRYGKLRVIGFATLACAVGSTGAALAAGLHQLVAFRALTGITAAGIIPLSMAWLGDTVAYERRQAALAHMLSGATFGLIAGQLLGGIFADTLGWRGAFAALAGLSVATGVMLLVMSPATAPGRARKSVGRHAFAGGFRQLMANRRSRVVLPAVFLEGLTVFGVLAFIPALLHQRLGVSLTVAGGVVAVYGAGGLAYALAARALVARLGESGLARGGGMLLFGSFLLLAGGTNPGLAVAATFAAGLGFYMLHNTLQINATQMVPGHRGTALSVFACALFLGQSLGIALGALVVGLADGRFLLAGASILVLVTALLFARSVARWQGLPQAD